MAIDGSYSIESALERFLSRCPKLSCLQHFQLLSGKVTEEEVVNLVAELFLHPHYTIPLIGCFRPIAQKIVDKAVSLLRLVPNLRSNLDEQAEVSGKFDDADVIDVVQFHVRSGRGLNLHELACLAFCRMLDLAPFLLGSVLTYFKFAPPPFEHILAKRTVHELSVRVVKRYLDAVRTSYRLLIIEPEIFSSLWDWSCFLDLVKNFGNLDLGNGAELKEDIADIRWCGIQILSVTLRMSDRAIMNFGVEAEEALACLLRWQEFCQDTSLEKAGLYIEPSDYIKSEEKDVSFNQENCLQCFGLNSLALPTSKEIEPSARRQRRLAKWDNKSDINPFVLTSTVKRSFEVVLLAVSQKWPVLLYGPAGSGKSALINKLASESGNHVLSIHMDDQLDGKTLIGSYVCMEQPGEFRWQPGSLTQAILHGFWVVFEDIDKAPSDVQSILLPLLEGASSFVTGHGEEVRVTESFRLFSTISTSNLDVTHRIEGGSSLGTLWRRVMIMPPTSEDLRSIVKTWYPNLEFLADRLIETFERINSYPLHHSTSVSSLSRFSLRDLIKWCKRIADLDFSSMVNSLSSSECLYIYQEAVDIFASFSASAESRLTMMKELSKMWPVPVSAAKTLYPCSKPVIEHSSSKLRIGRVTLPCSEKLDLHGQTMQFVKIRSSLHLLERIASCVRWNEPVLLVGETGTGKTTLVQNLAKMVGQRLTVLNLSQQSDVADLLGGFKPSDARFICIPLYKEFEYLFSKTFSIMENSEIFSYLQKVLSEKDWKKLLKVLSKYVDKYQKMGKKRKKALGEEWENFSEKLDTARRQIASSGMVFSFVEGAFVTALRKGEWILLDEVNLAPPETLQRIIGVLEGESGSLCLAERGDLSYISRHPNFRIFACMNPATDAGKRDLPYSLRSRFTEFFVDDVLDDKDLELFIEEFLGESKRSDRELIERIRSFYKAAKKESEEKLQDGANQKPQYSLRSLYRALEFTRKAEAEKKLDVGFRKALFDGFCMFFLTLLDEPSAKIMKQMIGYLLEMSIPPPVPFDRYLMVNKGITVSDEFLKKYILTKSVKDHLSNLARAIFVKRYPILLQGPTSSGKTSLVQYLSTITGHEFVRINNHEHTDLQEYLGSYITDASGKLVFREGVLVKAVRNGYWIVLDELNLAPSDVLEALNRLLDDNRELFVPELCETIKAHPNFMLFATQNPPTFYGGRKMLSRAFRNRFVEIHVDEIPENELSTILEKRCEIPESYAKKMVEVMKELQLHRQSSKVFAGKHGFITPRDLFRWANRFKAFGKSYEDLARDGYYLLAERLRDEGERCVVQEVLERHLRVRLVKDDLYQLEQAERDSVLKLCNNSSGSENIGNVIWTRSMQRLYFLVKRCYELREPVLLVGETGGGKTTVGQLLSLVLGLNLRILNCHQYTETSDFVGGFYPVRDRSRLLSEFDHVVEQLRSSKALIHYRGDSTISSDIGQAALSLNKLAAIIKSYREGQVSSAVVNSQDIDILGQLMLDLGQLHQRWQTIFMWDDGPLVQAMKDGSLFLVDEISLADDSVLERLNSVLEPERKLSLAEKGGSSLETVTAHKNFFVLATMNPGGDYGKKELSPALRNRFTEIWVPPVSDLDELKEIALWRFTNPGVLYLVGPMLTFWEWFSNLQTGRMLTVRDLLSWVAFINVTESSLLPDYAFLHGVFLIVLDGLSLGTGMSKRDAVELSSRCLSFLLGNLKVGDDNELFAKLSIMESYGWGDLGAAADNLCSDDMQCDNLFGIHPFYIKKGNENTEAGGFEFLAPTTRRNVLRVLRAMQLSRPVLLEGSPGVGKTSLIVALGKYSGHKVVRINLSEQTDIMDLLGSDLPMESDEGMKFAWSDGILLQAIKEGCWVLLDELNLAPQSVLEGLNAILDHRGEVFIPELGLTFKCPSSFRVFACQNPSYQGGGRKGLPKSFLNRFTKVYVDELVEDDYLFICSSLYPSIPRPLLLKLILFNKRLHEETMVHHNFAQDGSPWEFNLRDVIRSCQIIQGASVNIRFNYFLSILYIQRMRTANDRREVLRLCEQIFGMKPFINPFPRVQLNSQYLIVGNTAIKRNCTHSSKLSSSQLKVLPGIRHCLEAAACCVQHQWLCILVGPPSSGKTSLIRLLAQLTGNVLNELNLSSATDISELLGCFEQYNAFHSFRLVVAEVERYVNEYCSLKLESSVEAIISERKDMISKWLSFVSSVDFTVMSSSHPTYTENWKIIGNSLCLLVEIVEKLRSDLENNVLPLSWSIKELDRTMKTIKKLQDSQQMPYSVKFEWVTGSLIKAIENGEWIVLENANLCNPTVLDRINSLVEPCGAITVNECGTIDGKPLVLQPHPNFRMFLTVNPSYGEVSRAMRNRGVEIYMMPPYWLFDEGSPFTLEDSALKDVERFLALSGIPAGKLVESMAKAHICAGVEGLQFNKPITYLELARWVQLFKQLLMNGNQPMWSLQISWEHIYLSSLGEAEGENIISYVKSTYLSTFELSEFCSSLGCSLTVPGGWPMPLKLRDFVWYSKEACVRQNCMYLEFLGAQYASCEFQNHTSGHPANQTLTASNCGLAYLMNVKILQKLMFPKVSNGMYSDTAGKIEFNSQVTNKMLLFAANWTIEQATASDFQLYLLWFSWFSSQLQPYGQFFNSFLASLKAELEDPIWKNIFSLHQELACLHQVELDSHPIPVLSMELADITSSNDTLKVQSELLSNAINCVDLLRLSYQQWTAEKEHDYNGDAWYFQPFLGSLRNLEKEFLKMVVKSSSFDKIIQLYADLLEDHILFWKSVTLSQSDSLLISWRSLMKKATKMHSLCQEEVETVLMNGKNLGKVSSWRFHTERSLLWVNGGHPFLPRSARLYHQQHQLLKFCEFVWPKQVDDSIIDVAASSNPELRFLALQGVCMSSHILCKSDEDDVDIVQQLEEMYEMLVKRFEHEKQKLEANLCPDEHALFDSKLVPCCAFYPEMLCRKPGFDSWLDTLPVSDCTSWSMDMNLLRELSLIALVDHNELQQALGSVSNLLESTLKYSLNNSRRPPQSFVPHQRLLWMLDAWTSVDAVNIKVGSFVLDIWFWWHSFLWIYHSASFMSFSKLGSNNITLPELLFQPVKISTVFQILQSICPIQNYSEYCLKLKSASRNIWQSHPTPENIPSFLLHVARSLFHQIIYAHKKSFDAEKFAGINSMLFSFETKITTQENINLLSSLIASSSHQKLKSLVHLYVDPLLRELYLSYSSTGFHSNLGFVWLLVGGLRFHLLLICDDLDPATKDMWKCSQLEEKILLLELEIKVRQECEYLAGWYSSREADKKRAVALQKLEAERKKLQRKIVFRPDPLKFKALKNECDEFLELINSVFNLMSNIAIMDLQQAVERINNWQETASCFIDRLSLEYIEYIDITQPVQVAAYEMKLGLSIVLSSILQKEFLNKVEEDNMDKVMDSIYSLMRFPRGYRYDAVLVNLQSRLSEHTSHDVDFPLDLWAMDISLLEKLVIFSSEVDASKEGSALQLRAAVHQNALMRVAHFVATSRLVDKASFMLLDRIFCEFASIWVNMKDQTKSKEDRDSQQYKFWPRAFTIDRVFEDKSNDTLEWQEFLLEEEFTEKVEDSNEHESLEEEWNLMQESILNNMVHIHNQLFGSIDLVLNPGQFQLSDADRLLSFNDSYTLGVEMLKGFGGLFSSTLDAKLAPESLLRLCWEHEQKFASSHNSAGKYNFYKDSNAPVIAKMVKALSRLKQRLRTLLTEWEDHPGLQRILDLIEMLLAFPLATPVAKPLSGLQILLTRVQMLQENGTKFPLSDLLEPITALVCLWQKMEFESWPVLLDEVHDQYESNAGKLWFPLYSVLRHKRTGDSGAYDQSTIQSLEEFIQTSSIGEFRKRLLLLYAFLGQFVIGRSLGIYSSPWQEENLKILYNVFGFYVQFLPLIMEHIGTSRRNIEAEVKDVLKLCRWERLMPIDNLKRIRQKIRKLVQKYTEILQQPAILIFNREMVQKGFKTVSLQSSKAPSEISDESVGLLKAVLDLAQFSEKERPIWYSNWRKRVTDSLQNLHLGRAPELGFLDVKEILNSTKHVFTSLSEYESFPEEWKALWQTVENICKTTMDSGHLWMDMNKSVGKKRALSDLLKLLENSGLHKHKFEIMKISNHSSWLFLQPSYDAQHLLLTRSRLSHTAATAAAPSEFQDSLDGTLDTEWKAANEFYFKSLASVQLLQQICLKHHGDFTAEQIDRSISFLNHLIVIQQMQRDAAYDFANNLKRLHELASAFASLCSSCSNSGRNGNEWSYAQSQHVSFECIWQQKQLLDSLHTLLMESSLLLRTVEKAHNNNSCQSVRSTIQKVLAFIERFAPAILKSKELLDNYLLGNSRAITVMNGSFSHRVISKQVEQLVIENFQVINEFEEHFSTFRKHDMDRSSVIASLFSHLDDLLTKGKLMAEQFNLAIEAGNHSTNPCDHASYYNGSHSEFESLLGGSLMRTCKNILDMLQNLGGSLSNGHAVSEESMGSVTSWESIFKSSVGNLSFKQLEEQLVETITYAEKLVNNSGCRTPNLSFQIGAHYKYLHTLLDLVLSFGNSFLQDLLALHKTMSIMTHALANILASLYSKGFGVSDKEQEDDSSRDQDASGTGMGEGAGMKDVSDQIDDEDQLLGTDEKQEGEEQDASDKVPSKDDKGIEMEQDFAADTFSVSEDSGGEDDDDKDGKDEQLESAMGETGADNEVIDEKLWNKEEEENPSTEKEKYESGPAVKDKDECSRELRAKEDSAMADEPGELDFDENDGQRDEDGDQDDLGDAENAEDLNMDKDEAFADPTGLNLDESNQNVEEDIDMDEKDGTDTKEEDGLEELENEGMDTKEEVGPEDDEHAENGNIEEVNTNPVDVSVEEAENEQAGGSSEKDDLNRESEDNKEMNLMDPRKDVFEAGIPNDQVPNPESAVKPSGGSWASNLKNVAPEANWSNSDGMNDDVVPSSLPSSDASQMDIMVAGSSSSGKLTDQPGSQLPEQKPSAVQKSQTNPYRNVGDALEEWKERVNVSVDLQADNTETQGEVEDENADEYGYVSEYEKGTAQALGPATAEQIDTEVNGSKPDIDSLAAVREDATEMEIDKKTSESHQIEHHASILKHKMEQQMQISDPNNLPMDGSPEVQRDDVGAQAGVSESLISVKKNYLNEEIHQLSKLSASDDEHRIALELDEVSDELRDDASALWRRYELQTTRLSQELAEQLRLVMEPTLASKLQGDYKTGKRINMKKVIPYIASHYRKDKIWLRRTRPNKRDYQVVIAMDDSRSMSESGCGDVAIEALVTVCRAMSQLEMGNLSVVSFGKKGNIRSLHDFDQPFTGMAGIKMISGLTFRQENTIADEPVVDLLKFLNNMLDVAVGKARLPSGQNPLQQLVLIIGDGRFHEKENLKRWVRDLLAKKRMVAFLLLDSPQESILDLKELSFQGKEIKVSKYLDSFPFPYYIVLRNIEALPRTLADLLRQWFELMQYTKE